MSVREWAAIWVELRRQRGREVETREWLRLWESEEEIWAELQQCDGDEGESDWESEDWGRNLGWAATVRRWRGRGRDERVIETWESEDWEWLREGFRVRLRVIFERGLKKKKMERRHIGGEKKAGTMSFKGWNKGTVRTVWTDHDSQNRTVGPRSGRFHAFFVWNGFLP